MDYQESLQYRKTAMEAMDGLSGRAGKIARIIGAIKDDYDYQKQAELERFLLGGGNTLESIFKNGPYNLYLAVHGREMADKALKAAGWMDRFAYSTSLYRRSFRTADVRGHGRNLMSLVLAVLFPWNQWYREGSLDVPQSEYGSVLIDVNLISSFIALEIDEGNESVIEAVKDVCLNENSTHRMNDAILRGIVKSRNESLHELLCDLLLAARLQEGLRQSILETADLGTVKALHLLMQTVLDNNLLRYSSAVRAVGTWMGMGYSFEEKRGAEKLLQLGLAYLKDPDQRKKAVESKDALQLYAALWATAVCEAEDVLPMIKSMLTGAPYQKLVALFFAAQTELTDLQVKAALMALDDDNLDVLTYAVFNLPLTYGWGSTKKEFQKNCQRYEMLKDKKLRHMLFSRLGEIVQVVPKNGHIVEGKPFEWAGAALRRETVFTILMTIAGYDLDPVKSSTLLNLMELADSHNKERFIAIFLDSSSTGAERAFLFRSLGDRSMPVRIQALKTLKPLKLSEDEVAKIMELLALKTGHLRQNAVEILLTLPGGQPVTVAKALLTDRSAHKRMAGLDMLTRLVKAQTLTHSEAAECTHLMPKVTDAEQILVDALTCGSSGQYNKENGFGLYDPGYCPEFPPLPAYPQYTAQKVFAINHKRMISLFDALCRLIEENKDYAYSATTWGDGSEDVMLGGQQYLRFPADVGGEKPRTLANFVLPDVWRSWMLKENVTGSELMVFLFMYEIRFSRSRYHQEYQPWVGKLLEKHFNMKEVEKLSNSCMDKPYGRLALGIMGLLWDEIPKADRFAMTTGVLRSLFDNIPQKDFGREAELERSNAYYVQSHQLEKLSEIDEILFFHQRMKLAEAGENNEQFRACLAAGFALGQFAGYFYINLDVTDVARGVALGMLKEDALCRSVMMSGQRCLSRYAGKVTGKHHLDIIKQYPQIKEVADRVSARVIEIELGRGDSQTEVSQLADEISWHEGADTFARILIAMGKETFHRGYLYGSSTKKQMLSSLLKASHPAPGDDADSLRKALDGRVSDQRLLEAAMYAPAWLNIVADLLGWKGLHSAAWYFHAHVNETFSAEKETEVARYSPIESQEFNDGAFDVDWFKDAYKGVGAERFQLLYGCAKYITDGANHRRAQLFADAALGKLKVSPLAQEIRDKRSKDKLLSYALIPLGRNKMKDALARYEFIQEFLLQSKAFGAMRQENEKKAAAIALENLARNAGFSDGQRFRWHMESLKIKELSHWFVPQVCDDTMLWIAFDGGVPALVCEKDGKKLTSIPARLKKNPIAVEGKEVASSLKAQQKRARVSLEQAMVSQDVFTRDELAQLMGHPVIAPLLQGLLFAANEKVGFFEEWRDLADVDKMVIAHPYNLYKTGEWRSMQKEAFKRQLVQPFKQIFRELYLINEDEQAEKTLSRRYAGHQVQPKKTVALLKGRGWTVDYEEGLQKVYYKENIVAQMYAAADWFSPADIEAPTLETVRFFDRKTRKELALTDIPPVLFSEVMRDIDLVVSVAHVGGVDPETSHSTVEMRESIACELLELLKLENVMVKDRHAIINGNLGEYTVHLGSGLVHQMGHGAIHILAIPSQHRGRVFLPFADDDPRTAEIMSKILLLAEDKGIKDPAILAQIQKSADPETP